MDSNMYQDAVALLRKKYLMSKLNKKPVRLIKRAKNITDAMCCAFLHAASAVPGKPACVFTPRCCVHHHVCPQ